MRTSKPVEPGRRLGMPISSWPAADQVAWAAAFVPAGPLDGRPLGALLRTPSRLALATCYARWLLWLTTNHPDCLGLPPGARVNEDRFIDYLMALKDQVTLRSLYGYAARLKRALQLLSPADDWDWLQPIIRRLERRARAAKSNSRPYVPSDQLRAFGIEMMETATADTGASAINRAEAFRDGLMFAFLAARPLRLKNMTGLVVGVHLLEDNGGYKIVLTPDDTKTHAHLEFPLPQRLLPYMRDYLNHHRKVLATGPPGAKPGDPAHANFLWLARTGMQFSADTFAHKVAGYTLERFGTRLTPHGFRHCAATTIAQNNPEEFHIIRIILGHTTIVTAEESYIHAKAMEATRMVQAAILKTRRSSAKQSATKRNNGKDNKS